MTSWMFSKGSSSFFRLETPSNFRRSLFKYSFDRKRTTVKGRASRRNGTSVWCRLRRLRIATMRLRCDFTRKQPENMLTSTDDYTSAVPVLKAVESRSSKKTKENEEEKASACPPSAPMARHRWRAPITLFHSMENYRTWKSYFIARQLVGKAF